MLISILINLIMIASPDPSLSPSPFKLPKTWTTDFSISVDYSGSMDGSSSHVEFTYDSCTYTGVSHRRAEGNYTVKFKMTEIDRKEILDKLRHLNVEKIRKPGSEIKPTVVNDGYSRTLCIGKTCMSGGPGAGLQDDDRSIFSTACTFLENFVNQKSKVK